MKQYALAAIGLITLIAGASAQNAQPPRRPAVIRQPQAPTMYGLPPAGDLAAVTADVVFLGVPYDLGHGSRPGTRLGPAAIREASNIAGPRIASDGGFYD